MALGSAPLPFLQPVQIFLPHFLTSTVQILIESYLQVRCMKISQNFIQTLLMALNTFASWTKERHMTSYLQWYNIIVMYTAHHFAKNHFLKVNSQL